MNYNMPPNTAVPILNGRAFRGMALAYGTLFVIELFGSSSHPGYYHYMVACIDDAEYEFSHRPMKVGIPELWQSINYVLQSAHGIGLQDVKWREVSRGELLPMSQRRLDAGE